MSQMLEKNVEYEKSFTKRQEQVLSQYQIKYQTNSTVQRYLRALNSINVMTRIHAHLTLTILSHLRHSVILLLFLIAFFFFMVRGFVLLTIFAGTVNFHDGFDISLCRLSMSPLF